MISGGTKNISHFSFSLFMFNSFSSIDLFTNEPPKIMVIQTSILVFNSTIRSGNHIGLFRLFFFVTSALMVDCSLSLLSKKTFEEEQEPYLLVVGNFSRQKARCASISSISSSSSSSSFSVIRDDLLEQVFIAQVLGIWLLLQTSVYTFICLTLSKRDLIRQSVATLSSSTAAIIGPCPGRDIIADHVKRLGSHMVQMYAEHRATMEAYHQRCPLPPTQRRRKTRHGRPTFQDVTSDDALTRLARDTLEYIQSCDQVSSGLIALIPLLQQQSITTVTTTTL